MAMMKGIQILLPSRCGAYFYARAALPIPTGLLKDGTAAAAAAAAASCNPVV